MKKNDLSAGNAEDQKPSTLPDQRSLPQDLPNATMIAGPQSTAALSENKSAKSKARQREIYTNVDSSRKPTETNKSQSSGATPSSKEQHDHSNKIAIHGPSTAPDTGKPEGQQSEASEKISKKKLRRRSAFRAKQAALLNGQQEAATLAKSNHLSSSQAKFRPSISDAHKSEATPSDAALLQQTTKTHLIPRPKKQWVEQEDAEQDDSTTANDASTIHEAGNSILDPFADALWISTAQSPPAQKKSMLSSKNKSAASVNEMPGYLATVGVPSPSQTLTTVSTPLARPGIDTIASFSLSSRRHPASILAKQRPSSGLSGIRMDTGMIGSSPKPVSANKANSVPSYAAKGDVKAAFDRFNKFAHGGNSSESNDDSEESDEESDADAETTTNVMAIQPAQRKAVESSATPLKSTSELKDPVSSGPPEVNNTVRTNDPIEDRVSDSAESSESDSEASGNTPMLDLQPAETAAVAPTSHHSIEVPNTHEDAPAQLPHNAPRMLGEKDLPLFSDFNAKHNITPADTAIERSANFLERELGGAPSGFGQTDDTEIPIIDYVASQDADDLYRSIEDISREVFGSIRELPDCKPLSNSLDVAPERFVTDKTSNHGLGRKSAELETPLEKTTVLSSIVRKSSPIVYIANEMETGISTMKDDDEERDEVNEEVQNAEDEPPDATQGAELERQSSTPSSSSTLTPSPTPSKTERQDIIADTRNDDIDADNEINDYASKGNSPINATEVKKRKLTGTTSKHFSPRRTLPRAASIRTEPASKYAEDAATRDSDDEAEQPSSSEELRPLQPKKKEGTGKTSTYFTPTISPSKPADTKKSTPLPKTPRLPKGTSICPVPSTESTYFGLIQEKLWKEPFWLIIAVTLLNKTAGRSAAPIFWNLKELYPTPMALAQANEDDLVKMIGTLGLQNQRARRLILIATTWVASPPAKNQRYRTLNYPAKGDGKGIKKNQVVEEDADECEGALEIGHIPGCGPYAWDSWRIFCRDVQRGLAQHYNDRRSGFEPEWQRVVPLDKELRACLRWMWLKEGYVWDHETGKRRDATLDEMVAGLKGEMEIVDEQERKFAVEAAGVGGDGTERMGTVVKIESGDEKRESVSKAAPSRKAVKPRSKKVSIARRELDVESADEVAVSTVRRSRRNKSG
ncbi:hypothetical protein MBLNU13_g06010t1 [Cladosporium sp. NU13]